MYKPSQNTPKPTYDQLKKENLQLKEAVAKLQAAEARLSENEMYLRTVVESLPFDVFAIDKKGRYSMQNSTCEKHWGKIIGKRPKDIKVDKDTLALWENNNVRAFAGETVEGEVVMRPNRKKGFYYNVISPIHDGEDIHGILGVNIDITERKLAEEALTESEEKFRTVTEQSPSMIFINKNGKVVYCNKKCEELMGYSQEEFCSLDFDFLDLISEESKRIVKSAFAKHLKGQEVETYEYRLVTKGGEKLDAIITTKLIQYEGESAILGIVTDITQRKEAEKALLDRERELEDKTHDLEEMNAALRILLKKRYEDKIELEEKIQFNVKKLIEPYLNDLKNTQLSSRQATLLGIIKTSFEEIISPFANNLASKYKKLTPKEIQIADLIKHGNSTKEIANSLSLSPRTIESHRKNIRLKLGIKKDRANLRTHLLSLK